MQRAFIFSALVIAGVFIDSLLSANAARADIPPPPRDLPDGKIPIPIEVSYDLNKDVSFLYIGREALKSAGGGEEKQSLRAPGATRSIVAAGALSLGLAGLLLLRGKRRAQIACGLVLAIGLGAIGIEAWANAPAPNPPGGPNGPFDLGDGGPNFKPKAFHGDAVVEIVDGDRAHQIRLVIGTKPKPQRQFRGAPLQSPPEGPPGGPPSPNQNAPAPRDPFDKKP